MITKKTIIAFTIISFAVGLGTLMSIGYRILISSYSAKNYARSNFEVLKSKLLIIKNAQDLHNIAFRKTMTEFFVNTPSLLFIGIYQRGGGVQWAIPAVSPYNSTSNNTKNQFSTFSISSPLPGDISGVLYVNALYTTVTQGAAFLPFRDGLIILGIFLILASLFLAITTLTKDKKLLIAPSQGIGDLGKSTISPDISEVAITGLDAIEVPLRKTARTFTPDEKVQPASYPEATTAEAISDSTEAYLEELPPDDVLYAESTEPSADHTANLAIPDPSEDFFGLFSPKTGLVSSSHLIPRLQSTLTHTKELCFLILSIEGLQFDPDLYDRIGERIRKEYNFDDLAFEVDSETFAIILPSFFPDVAIETAQSLLSSVCSLIQEVSTKSVQPPLYIGITSTGGREVDANTLYNEAKSAKEKAREDRVSGIIVFKADKEKFKAIT